MANFFSQSFTGTPDYPGGPLDAFHKWDTLQRIAQSEFQQGVPIVDAYGAPQSYVKDVIVNPLELKKPSPIPLIDPGRVRTAGPYADFSTGLTGIREGRPSSFKYQPSLSPQLQMSLRDDFWHSGAHPYHKALIEAEMMPLAAYQDPAYHYASYNASGRKLEETYKKWKEQQQRNSLFESPRLKEDLRLRLESEVAMAEAVAAQKKEIAIEADLAHKRQIEIEKVRRADPSFNSAAQELEQAARDLQQGKRSGLPAQEIVTLEEEFAKKWLSMNRKTSNAGLSEGLTGASRMGYLMEGLGTASMIPDISRLVRGGGVAIAPDGLPYIASKQEMNYETRPEGMAEIASMAGSSPDYVSEEDTATKVASARQRRDAELKSEAKDKALRKQAYDTLVRNNPNKKAIEREYQIKSSLNDWAEKYFK